MQATLTYYRRELQLPQTVTREYYGSHHSDCIGLLAETNRPMRHRRHIPEPIPCTHCIVDLEGFIHRVPMA